MRHINLLSVQKVKRHSTIFLILVLIGNVTSQSIMQSSEGIAAFTSHAPLEVIKADSKLLRGALDKESRTFAFTVDINSFGGFNSPLQQTHFNENYLESGKFPMATFAGKIIEDIDFVDPGIHKVRAKGKLKIHGVEQERIIRSNIEITSDGKIRIISEFTVKLKDHDIQIPKIVYQKIAEIIQVSVLIILEPKQS